jgi:cell wall assembly regulator SMI1
MSKTNENVHDWYKNEFKTAGKLDDITVREKELNFMFPNELKNFLIIYGDFHIGRRDTWGSPSICNLKDLDRVVTFIDGFWGG